MQGISNQAKNTIPPSCYFHTWELSEAVEMITQNNRRTSVVTQGSEQYVFCYSAHKSRKDIREKSVARNTRHTTTSLFDMRHQTLKSQSCVTSELRMEKTCVNARLVDER
jgi:hypothetical protein